MRQDLVASLDAEFLVLLPFAQVAAQRERLTDHLDQRFRDCRFNVQADFADLCGDRGWCVVPVVPTRADPGATNGEMIMGARPEPDLVRRVSRAVAEFATGKAGRLN